MDYAWILYTLVFVIMGIAVLATVAVGLSKQNREGNPGYDRKTGTKWARLTTFYVVCFGAAVICLILYIVKT